MKSIQKYRNHLSDFYRKYINWEKITYLRPACLHTDMIVY